MDNIVECRICGHKLTLNDKNTFQLGQHLMRLHPNADLTYFLFTDDCGDGIRHIYESDEESDGITEIFSAQNRQLQETTPYYKYGSEDNFIEVKTNQHLLQAPIPQKQLRSLEKSVQTNEVPQVLTREESVQVELINEEFQTKKEEKSLQAGIPNEYQVKKIEKSLQAEVAPRKVRKEEKCLQANTMNKQIKMIKVEKSLQADEPVKIKKCNYSQTIEKEKLSKATRVSVENWKTGQNSVHCPKCGNIEMPYIRKQRNKFVTNRIGSCCLWGCWPLCYLPLRMCGKDQIILCCRKCGHCLGSYDQKTGNITATNENINIELPNSN